MRNKNNNSYKDNQNKNKNRKKSRENNHNKKRSPILIKYLVEKTANKAKTTLSHLLESLKRMIVKIN